MPDCNGLTSEEPDGALRRQNTSTAESSIRFLSAGWRLTRHDVRAYAQNAGGALFDVDQLMKDDPSLNMIEKEIDVGRFACIIAGGRAEETKVVDAERPQVGLTPPQSGNGCVAVHDSLLAQRQGARY